MTEDEPQLLVVMTGATAGFGRFALQEIAARPGTRVLVGARGTNRVVPHAVETLPLDLASLASVRAFADAVKDRLHGDPIDVLALNAGVHVSDTTKRSADGYELTFSVNHLAHYLLARLLLPSIRDGGRLVFTTSNMHDPPFKRMAPKAVCPQEWAHSSTSNSGSGVRAYCASKLCNLMTAQLLARLDAVHSRGVDVVAFNPGLTGGSAGRDSSLVARFLVRTLMHTAFPVVGLFRPEFVMNRPEHSGKMLAEVALGSIAPPEGKMYVSLVKGRPTFPAPSALSQDQEAQERLWREGAAIVGLE